MKNKKNLWIALLSFVAVVVHAYLSKHFYGLKYGSPAESLCNLSASFNCDTTTASSFSNLFGVPIALFGVMANLVLLGWVLAIEFALIENKEKMQRYVSKLASVIALTSVVMLAISSIVIKAYCPFCMSTYVISFVVLGLSLSMAKPWTAFVQDFKDAFGEFKIIAISLVTIPILAFVAHDMVLQNGALDTITKYADDKVADWQSSTVNTFNDAGLSIASSTPATFEIVEFADFRCPHCMHAYPGLHAFTKAHPDVKFTFKAFPLDGTCNSAIKGGGDGISCELAYITFCAESLAQKGWAAHNYIFENQNRVRGMTKLDELYAELDKNLALKIEDLKKCVGEDTTITLIKEMAAEGERAKIDGTPAVFVNGKKLSGGQLLPILEKAYALNKNKK